MEVDSEHGLGSSSTMRRLEEGRRLPWRLVQHSTWIKLANKLDLPSPVSNNDWKGLAEKLDFTTEDILVLDTGKERNTVALFTNYLPKKNSSVNDVAKGLKAMNRDDALQILLDAVPEIEERFNAESQQKAALEVVEGEDMHACRCIVSQASVGCTEPRSHSGSSSCSGYHAHPHHRRAQPCSMNSCCCRHGMVLSPHCHTPPHAHSGGASPLVYGCHSVGAAGGVSHMPPGGVSHMLPKQLVYNISPGGGDTSMFNKPVFDGTLGMGRKDYCLISHTQQADRGGMLQQPQHPRRIPIQYLADYPHAYGESMVVHHDMDSRHHHGLQPFTANDDSMDIDCDSQIRDVRREEPAHLPATIARGQGLISASMQLPMDVMSDNGTGEDTPSTSMEELSSSDSGTRLSSLPLNVRVTAKRQLSEERNSQQPNGCRSSGRRVVYDHEALDNWGDGTKEAMGEAVRATGHGDAYKASNARERSQSSLESLKQLSQLPSRYMPDNKYTTIVAEQKIDNPNSGRNDRNIKREKGETSRTCQFAVGDNCGAAALSSASSSSSSRRLKETTGADTYPMRVKCQPGGATVEQVRNRQPGTLTKSISVPIDLKVEEFKRAFHHIKVFVTYANDSRPHSRQVLSLCNCLQKNGFSCCVDVNQRQDSTESSSAQDWVRRFKEADFILVCLSPFYLQEMKRVDAETKSANSKQPLTTKGVNSNSNRSPREILHASQIYKLMCDEYQRTNCCSRFVLLYVEGSPRDGYPAWLTDCLVYNWPHQYKDLLWMLTKPEERIKQRPSSSRTSPTKGHRGLNGFVASPLK